MFSDASLPAHGKTQSRSHASIYALGHGLHLSSSGEASFHAPLQPAVMPLLWTKLWGETHEGPGLQ